MSYYRINEKGFETWNCDIIHLPTKAELKNIRLKFSTLNEEHVELHHAGAHVAVYNELYSPYKDDDKQLELFMADDDSWLNFGVILKNLIESEISETWGEKDEDAEYEAIRDIA